MRAHCMEWGRERGRGCDRSCAVRRRRYMGCETCGEPGVECTDATTESRIEASADALTRDLKAFLDSTSTAKVAGGNMSVPRNPQTAQARAAEVAMEAAREEIKNTEEQLLVDETDRRQKNVDSGKVAIIFTSDGMRTFYEKWAGTSKERRRWAADTLGEYSLGCVQRMGALPSPSKWHPGLGHVARRTSHVPTRAAGGAKRFSLKQVTLSSRHAHPTHNCAGRDRNLAAKLIFIEVIVNSPKLLERNLRAKFRHEQRLAAGERAADHMRHTVQALSATAQGNQAAGAGAQAGSASVAPEGKGRPWTSAPPVPIPAASIPTPPRRRMGSNNSDHDWAATMAGISIDEAEEIPPRVVRAFFKRVNEFARVYVSLQEDGSEDDLSYIKLINYGEQVCLAEAAEVALIRPRHRTEYTSRLRRSAAWADAEMPGRAI
eukprot:scaffold55343_cov37-Tisochrysis_lutea.AAC.2